MKTSHQKQTAEKGAAMGLIVLFVMALTALAISIYNSIVVSHVNTLG